MTMTEQHIYQAEHHIREWHVAAARDADRECARHIAEHKRQRCWYAAYYRRLRSLVAKASQRERTVEAALAPTSGVSRG